MTNLIPNEVHYTDHMMPFSLVKDQSFKYVIYHEIPFDNIFQYAFWSPILPLNRVKTEFRRIKGNINSMREHAELLSSVRDDITDFKTSGSMSPRMQLLRERAAIHGNISHIDDVISQAQATRAVLGSQRTLFTDVQGKVKGLGDKFPMIRSLLGSIRRRRSRDTLILSAVIAACTLFLIIYWLSK
uniref:Golgi SNAP receptor complex member 1 n=1 Tax=Phaseolus vulgaris TaxID=3885 RepID=V7ANE5_PHAVU|nr:hypothetical protein PHAVU_010G079400g [Phaseolus vulgaris]ESW06820.1 hypothetical protein PHAVU_010G079400g [Phaseolus vulgaris]